MSDLLRLGAKLLVKISPIQKFEERESGIYGSSTVAIHTAYLFFGTPCIQVRLCFVIQMVSGFITSVQGKIVNDKRLVVLEKVRHSQKMNVGPMQVWIITENDETILSAHCIGCMAGLGECCSHVASMLFYLEVWARLNGKLASTKVICTLILPSFVKEI